MERRVQIWVTFILNAGVTLFPQAMVLNVTEMIAASGEVGATKGRAGAEGCWGI